MLTLKLGSQEVAIAQSSIDEKSASSALPVATRQGADAARAGWSRKNPYGEKGTKSVQWYDGYDNIDL